MAAGVSKELLKPAVLVFQRLQPFGVGDLEPAILGLPFVERCLADPVTSAKLSHLRASFLLLQDTDDLLFAEPPALHIRLLKIGEGLYSKLVEFQGARSIP